MSSSNPSEHTPALPPSGSELYAALVKRLESGYELTEEELAQERLIMGKAAKEYAEKMRQRKWLD